MSTFGSARRSIDFNHNYNEGMPIVKPKLKLKTLHKRHKSDGQRIKSARLDTISVDKSTIQSVLPQQIQPTLPLKSIKIPKKRKLKKEKSKSNLNLDLPQIVKKKHKNKKQSMPELHVPNQLLVDDFQKLLDDHKNDINKKNVKNKSRSLKSSRSRKRIKSARIKVDIK